MLDSIASCGAQYVEPALIVGDTEPFGESSFRLSNVPQYLAWLEQGGLQCFAFSSHIDPGWIQIVDPSIFHNPAHSATISLSVATACFQKICDILPIHRGHGKSHMSPGFVTSRNQDVS